jgi:hypothetical protein
MLAAAFAAITAFQMVLFCENDKPFRTEIEIIRFQTVIFG